MLQPKSKQQPADMPVRVPAAVDDNPEVKRTAEGIIKVLKKSGRYEPEVDNIWVYRIAHCNHALKKIGFFLQTPTASEHTIVRMTDAQAKQQAMIEHAMEQLSLSRRDRLEEHGDADLKRRLREAIEKACKP